jgi:hypothetical protein
MLPLRRTDVVIMTTNLTFAAFCKTIITYLINASVFCMSPSMPWESNICFNPRKGKSHNLILKLLLSTVLQPCLLFRDSCVPGKHRVMEKSRKKNTDSIGIKGLGVESSDSPSRILFLCSN